MRVIAWAYDADLHCQACAAKHFGTEVFDNELTDREGNYVYPVFATDELDTESAYCGDCLEPLE